VDVLIVTYKRVMMIHQDYFDKILGIIYTKKSADITNLELQYLHQIKHKINTDYN
jgi:hypothetical protein